MKAPSVARVPVYDLGVDGVRGLNYIDPGHPQWRLTRPHAGSEGRRRRRPRLCKLQAWLGKCTQADLKDESTAGQEDAKQ